MARSPRLYFDEDMSAIIASRLRKAGWDVLRAHQAGKCRATDAEQLRFATRDGRVVVTRNCKHFIQLHEQFLQSGETHEGIIICLWRPSVEVMLLRLVQVLEIFLRMSGASG